MSKEIAQAVGSKRLVALLAILAAFAVLATFASNWSAKADLAVSPTISSNPAGGNVAQNSTVTYTATAPHIIGNATGTLTVNLPAGVSFVSSLCSTTAAGGTAVAGTNSCSVGGTVTTNGTVTLTVTTSVSAANGATINGATATASGAGVSTTPATSQLSVVGTSNSGSTTVLVGQTATITFTLPAGVTYCSDATGGDARAFTAPDQTLSGSLTTAGAPNAGTTVTTTPSTALDTVAGTHTVTVTSTNAGTVTVALSTHPSGSLAGVACSTSSATATVGTLAGVANARIVHVDVDAGTEKAADSFNGPNESGTDRDPTGYNGNVLQANGALGINLPNLLGRDDNDQATGSLHSVCIIPQTAGTAQLLTSANNADITWTVTPTVGNPTVSNGFKTGIDITDGGALEPCFSWRSANVGDQTVTATYVPTGEVIYSNGTQMGNGNCIGVPASETGVACQPLVAEWNTIDTTKIVAVSGVVGETLAGNTGELANWTSGSCVRDNNFSSLDTNCLDRANLDFQATGQAINVSGTLVPTGNQAGHLIAATQSFIEYALGSHVNYSGPVDGVKQTFYFNPSASVISANGLPSSAAGGTCGTFALEDPATGNSHGSEGNDAFTVLSSDKGVGFTVWPSFNFATANTSNADCLPGGKSIVVITSQEDVMLRSDLDTAPTEVIVINWTQAASPTKQVFLAWAGQRVILEHDWRIPAGNGQSGQVCGLGSSELTVGDNLEQLSDTATVVYTKENGPGGFVFALGANTYDDANTFYVDVATNTDDQDGTDPNTGCISQVIYESEDPGEVDIAVQSNQTFDLNLSKVAIVVYYMKLNTVTTSLVTEVSKPTHNGSTPNGAGSSVSDYSPGNPWDASKDDADNTADWNVSKDLLVRVRVTGWFLNSNPSGRPADTSNPLNVLPANRWVMPDDWALLAGGPADPADGSDAKGTAENFRPEYDIMFAPNNVNGIALTHPAGSGGANITQVTTVATGSTATAVKVNDASQINAGDSITVGATAATVTAKSGNTLTVTGLSAAPAAGTPVFKSNGGVPFQGPYSLLDLIPLGQGAALANGTSPGVGATPGSIRDTIFRDFDVDKWDAPMPPALVTVDLRGTGFLKQVLKEDVYYNGTANSPAVALGGNQTYPNAFYYSNIPDSPYIPPVVVGGSYFWDSWSVDGQFPLGQGAYHFWTPMPQFIAQAPGSNYFGVTDTTVTSAQITELNAIRTAYGDSTIGRTLVVYTDNHGEAMVTANGDFKTDLSACAANVLAGGKLCKPGDKVGTATIYATADYPDFRGKHFPVMSNNVTVNWTWGGYKDVTVEQGEDPQFKYIVFHAMDRDGFCLAPSGGVLLHSVLTSQDAASPVGSGTSGIAGSQTETVDFLIDSGEGIILSQSGGGTLNTSGNRQFATGVSTFSVAAQASASAPIKTFPLSALAAAGQTDECQAWIKVSNSLLGVLNVLAIAHDDEGDIGFDRIVDLQNTASFTLNFRWSLVTWTGADNIPVSDALHGTGANDAGNDIFDQVTAVYGWDAAAQDWLGFFPAGVSVPGANDLVSLHTGSAYWIAITGPGSVTWTIATNVGP